MRILASVQKLNLKENMEGLILTKAAAETLSNHFFNSDRKISAAFDKKTVLFQINA